MNPSESIYEILRGEAHEQNKLTRRDSDVLIDGIPISHAIDSDNNPILIVPIAKNDPDVHDDASRGVLLETFDVDRLGTTVRAVVARCLDPNLVIQFGLLADDILRSIKKDPSHPGATCITVLHRWRNLLSPADDSTLSAERQVGLLAELHLLDAALSVDKLAGLARWRGPDRARHDFQGPSCSVEVKATTSRDQMLIGIHGVMQLESPAGGELYLYVEQLELAPGGDSVASMVNTILAKGVNPHTFLSDLSKVGYRHQDAENYLGFTYKTLRRKVCSVDQKFPRIVRSTLINPESLDQIARVEYTVDVGPLPPATSDKMALAWVAERIVE